MATATELLRLVIDADAKGAISGLERVGVTADRELGKADDKLKKIGGSLTSFGAGALAAAGVASVGLFKLADAASAYGEQVNGATKIFGEEAVASLEKFADSAAKTAGLSKTLALQSANQFGALGKQAGFTGDQLVKFSAQITQLGGDLASFKDTTVEDALAALRSGLSGEIEPLRRYGVFLTDAKLKAEAYAKGIYDGTGALSDQQKIIAAYNVILRETTDAQGDFVDTSDSLANRQRTLRAEFENLKAGVGEGLVPVFETLFGAANGVLGSFQSLSPEAQGIVGSIAGIGVAGLGAAGGLSLITGFALQSVDTFQNLSDRLRTAEGDLTRVGTAAKVAAIAGTTLFAGFAIDQLIKGANADEAERFFNRFKGGGEDAKKSVEDLTLAGLRLKGFFSNLNPFTNTTADVITFADGTATSVRDLDRALGDLEKRGDFASIGKAIKDLRAVQQDPGIDEAEQEKINALIKEYNGVLNDAAAAGNEAAISTRGAAQASGELADGTFKTDTASKKATDSLKRYDVILKGVAIDMEALAKGAEGFVNAIEASTGLDDAVASAADFGQAFKGAALQIGALPAELDTLKLAFGGYNDEQTAALQNLTKLGEANADYLASLIAQGRSADEVRLIAEALRQKYGEVFDQLGLTAPQAEEYNRILGLTPDQVNTAISLSGEEEARFKIEAYKDFLDGEIPEEITSQVLTFIDEGRLQEAAFVLTLWRQDQEDEMTELPVGADTDQATVDVFQWVGAASAGKFGKAVIPTTLGEAPGLGSIFSGPLFDGVSDTVDFGGVPRRRAKGGPVSAMSPYLVGEQGPELFVPKTSGEIIPNGVGGGVTIESLTINGVEPELTATATVRRLRDAVYLVG